MRDNKDFNKEISEYLPFIRKICFGFADNEDELNDFTQEVLIQIWRKIDTFKGEAKFSTWIYRVTVNVCLYEVSKKKKNEKIKTDLMRTAKGSHSSPKEESSENQINLLYKAIKQLSQLDRAIIMLYLEKKTHNEIAEIIGLSQSNVGVRINRIKKKLKQLMSNERN
ncbi:sigma-70 family RNA polymerase sigma factor [Leptobacterium flavescens]|uniref:Sigma-70 family RNA polymerase sigma factor n=1 Tax=Leptobacterium flavescens TaxID=472055 RepID=A0A6P0UID5_9FLAO|nr:sigma-70 family RNA polymerase sigma factor [Leptobacterium flavescens]NER12757.1 sigma-70 family RNA polymerase sigma factor [Leptobacterium flavescens]